MTPTLCQARASLSEIHCQRVQGSQNNSRCCHPGDAGGDFAGPCGGCHGAIRKKGTYHLGNTYPWSQPSRQCNNCVGAKFRPGGWDLCGVLCHTQWGRTTITMRWWSKYRWSECSIRLDFIQSTALRPLTRYPVFDRWQIQGESRRFGAHRVGRLPKSFVRGGNTGRSHPPRGPSV